MMNDIDEKIRHALNAEDQKILDQFGEEPGPLGFVADTFKGSQWWFTTALWIGGFAAFAVMVYCTLNYFAAEDVRDALSWGLGILISGMVLVIVKIGAWQQMQTQMLLREIKRLELRWMNTVDH